jgi:hypothetical protein
VLQTDADLSEAIVFGSDSGIARFHSRTTFSSTATYQHFANIVALFEESFPVGRGAMTFSARSTFSLSDRTSVVYMWPDTRLSSLSKLEIPFLEQGEATAIIERDVESSANPELLAMALKLDERWDSEWERTPGSFEFEEENMDVELLLYKVSQVEQFSECWLAFRQWLRGCYCAQRPFLNRRSTPLAALPLLAQKVDALSTAIECLRDKKRSFAITTDQITCIRQSNGKCPESMIMELLRMKYEMGEDSFCRFVETYKDIPGELLRSLWDAIPMSLFDPKEQAEAILNQLDALSPSQVTTALFWVLCRRQLSELEEESQEWMHPARETLTRLTEDVNEYSLIMFERASIEVLTRAAEQIGAVVMEIRALNVLVEQFSGCPSVVLNLYYHGKAQAASQDERESFRNRIFACNERTLDHTIDVLLHGQSPDRGSCRMFVSQAKESCLVATSITSTTE